MLRVLVVDDNTMFRDVFSRGLDHQPDIEISAQAGSLVEALGKLEDIDVVITDRGLPDGDGLELVGALREANPEAKLLVMSSTVESMHPSEALEAGADAILDKLDTLEQIATQIRAVHEG